MESPSAVSFDIWNTLIKSNPAFQLPRADVIARLYDVSLEEAQRASKFVDDALDHDTERTGIDAGCEDRIAAIGAALKKRTPDASTLREIADEIQTLFLAFPPTLLEGEQTSSALAALKGAGVPVYFVSNTGFIRGTTMRQVMTSLGLFEKDSPAVFSNECKGLAKPSPDIFRILERYGADLRKTLHVGDSLQADYAGARGAGMHAVLLDRGKYREKEKEGLACVRSVSEIPALLGITQ